MLCNGHNMRLKSTKQHIVAICVIREQSDVDIEGHRVRKLFSMQFFSVNKRHYSSEIGWIFAPIFDTTCPLDHCTVKCILMSWLDNIASNQFFHDFISTTINCLNSCVSIGTCNWGLHHISPSTMKL